MSELKAGDTKTFEVGGEKLIVGPIPFGRLKIIIRLVADVSSKFEKKEVQDDLFAIVPKLVEEYVDEFIPTLFDKKTHPFLTKEWIENNLTIPLVKEIIVTAITVNALGDFFAKTVKVPATLTVEQKAEAQKKPSETIQTPSGNTGSITSSDSPTGGVPAMLTS